MITVKEANIIGKFVQTWLLNLKPQGSVIPYLKIHLSLGQVPERDQGLEVRNLVMLQSRSMNDIFYS